MEQPGFNFRQKTLIPDLFRDGVKMWPEGVKVATEPEQTVSVCKIQMQSDILSSEN